MLLDILLTIAHNETSHFYFAVICDVVHMSNTVIIDQHQRFYYLTKQGWALSYNI